MFKLQVSLRDGRRLRGTLSIDFAKYLSCSLSHLPQVIWSLSCCLLALITLPPESCLAADRLNLLSFGGPGQQVDRNGHADASEALSRAVTAANAFTVQGQPACVYVPAGTYRIKSPPPPLKGAGCIVGDGSTQSILKLDPSFTGDLFSWSEAWAATTPGPRVIGLAIYGSNTATSQQNALVFYDRNDEVYLDDIEINQVHGRALFSGVARTTREGYMRESHMRSLRFFRDGAPGVPVVEFTSQGHYPTDATNEIRMSQVDIYGSRGPGFVIRNGGGGSIRNITIDQLRIEGSESGKSGSDLITLGDQIMAGSVNNIVLSNVELIDPPKGYAALRITAPINAVEPYQITMQGFIGGGHPEGEGLRIEAGRASVFRLSSIHTMGENVVIGARVRGIVLDGGGEEGKWTYQISASAGDISSPALSKWPH